MKHRSNIKKKKYTKVLSILFSLLIVFGVFTLSRSIYLHKQPKQYGSKLKNSNNAISENKGDNNSSNNLNNKNTDTEASNDALENSIPNESIASIYKPDGNKIAYLTFDDGPSPNVTPRILNTLDKYNVKATFFIVGRMANSNKEILKREKAEGNVIANHTYSHDYKYIYSNPKALLDDLSKNDKVIKSIIGSYNNKLIRFPGGSFGSKRELFRQAVSQSGYTYIDWNALTGDTDATTVKADKLFQNFKNTSRGKEHLVILMHDLPTKTTTADILPSIIEYLKSENYTFKTL